MSRWCRYQPYTLELNPVERVWLYLGERFLSRRLLDDYDTVVQFRCAHRNAGAPTLPHQLFVARVCQCLGSAVS